MRSWIYAAAVYNQCYWISFLTFFYLCCCSGTYYYPEILWSQWLLFTKSYMILRLITHFHSSQYMCYLLDILQSVVCPPIKKQPYRVMCATVYYKPCLNFIVKAAICNWSQPVLAWDLKINPIYSVQSKKRTYLHCCQTFQSVMVTETFFDRTTTHENIYILDIYISIYR